MTGYNITYDKLKGYNVQIHNRVHYTMIVFYLEELMTYYTIKDAPRGLQKRFDNMCPNGFLFLANRVFEELGTNILTINDVKRYIINNYNAGNYDYRESKLLAQWVNGYVEFNEKEKRFKVFYKPTYVNINMQIVRPKELPELL